MYEVCFFCRFFDCQDIADADKPYDEVVPGYCRINPPSPGRYRGEDFAQYDYGQWPLVLAGEWCGAFEQDSDGSRARRPALTMYEYVRPPQPMSEEKLL
jgi:hypothetical protein